MRHSDRTFRVQYVGGGQGQQIGHEVVGDGDARLLHREDVRDVLDPIQRQVVGEDTDDVRASGWKRVLRSRDAKEYRRSLRRLQQGHHHEWTNAGTSSGVHFLAVTDYGLTCRRDLMRTTTYGFQVDST